MEVWRVDGCLHWLSKGIIARGGVGCTMVTGILGTGVVVITENIQKTLNDL